MRRRLASAPSMQAKSMHATNFQSKAGSTFLASIQDAENLLEHFNKLNAEVPQQETEVLKRAGLVMAMTAWETYVEDRVSEAAAERLQSIEDSVVAAFMNGKLVDEIKRLHNPTSEKTLQLFRDYAGVDLTDHWHWNHVDPAKARERLNSYMKLRGEVVHRSRVTSPGPTPAHAVNKDALQKAIHFLKELVKATESALNALTRVRSAADVARPSPPAD